MPIFAGIIIASLVLYIYFKVAFFRSNSELDKYKHTAKSRMSLGIFILSFGLNQIFIWDTLLTKIVGGLFIVYGGFTALQGYKAYRHYDSFPKEEGNRL
jgi:hypothetical protein